MNRIITEKQIELFDTLKKKTVTIKMSIDDYYYLVEELYDNFKVEYHTNIEVTTIFISLEYVTQLEIQYRELYKFINSSFFFTLFPEQVLLSNDKQKKTYKSFNQINEYFINLINDFIAIVKPRVEFYAMHKINGTDSVFISDFMFNGKASEYLEMFFAIENSGFIGKTTGETLKSLEFSKFLMPILNFNINDFDKRVSQMRVKSELKHPTLLRLINAYEKGIKMHKMKKP